MRRGLGVLAQFPGPGLQQAVILRLAVAQQGQLLPAGGQIGLHRMEFLPRGVIAQGGGIQLGALLFRAARPDCP